MSHTFAWSRNSNRNMNYYFSFYKQWYCTAITKMVKYGSFFWVRLRTFWTTPCTFISSVQKLGLSRQLTHGDDRLRRDRRESKECLDDNIDDEDVNDITKYYGCPIIVVTLARNETIIIEYIIMISLNLDRSALWSWRKVVWKTGICLCSRSSLFTTRPVRKT